MSEIYLFTFFAPCWALVGLRWLGLLENELNLGFGTLQHFGASKTLGMKRSSFPQHGPTNDH